MADYYNSTRGPLALTLNDGKSLVIPPKTWIFIEPSNENSSSIVAMLKKAFLVKAKVPITYPAAAPVAAVAAPKAAKTKSEVAPAAAEGKAESAPAVEEKASDSTSFFKKKR